MIDNVSTTVLQDSSESAGCGFLKIVIQRELQQSSLEWTIEAMVLAVLESK